MQEYGMGKEKQGINSFIGVYKPTSENRLMPSKQKKKTFKFKF